MEVWKILGKLENELWKILQEGATMKRTLTAESTKEIASVGSTTDTPWITENTLDRPFNFDLFSRLTWGTPKGGTITKGNYPSYVYYVMIFLTFDICVSFEQIIYALLPLLVL